MCAPVVLCDDMTTGGFCIWCNLPTGGQLNVVRLTLVVLRINETCCHCPIQHTVVLKLITR